MDKRIQEIRNTNIGVDFENNADLVVNDIVGEKLDDIEKDLEKMRSEPIILPDQIIATYHNGKQICEVHISIRNDENIGVFFEKGYVVVRTQNETKFVCKGKAFISLWR